MRRIKAVIASTVVGLGLVVGGGVVANAADYKVNLTEACAVTNTGYWYAQLVYPSQGAYGWRCTYPQLPWETKVYKSVDVQKYCTARYYGSVATTTNPSVADSWVCRK